MIENTTAPSLTKSKTDLLLIFTRNPELGKVKSRLAADVGDKNALEVYKILLKHTHTITKDLSVDKQVWYSENLPEKDIWDAAIFEKKLQPNIKDLGGRMELAFKKGFSKGYQNIIIIGSDLYDISQIEIERAFEVLKKNNAVIGPATDGGFYLLGLSKFIPELFKNKNWGTESVLNDTLINLKNYSFEKLDPKNDIDYLSDLKGIEVFRPYTRIEK